MSRTRIGLDIGATAVRAAELSMRGVPPSLVRIAQVPTPEGAVANGEVRDAQALAEALRDLWREGRFRSRDVILGVANQRVVVREVTVPYLSDKELRQSLAFQVQEFVPIPLEDAVLDYHVLEEFEREGRQMLRLLLVAAQRPMIKELIQAVEAAKLHPVGLDLVPFAIVRSAGSIDDAGVDSPVGDEAIVDVGAEVTSICIHAWGMPRFVRILPSGGNDITSAMAKAMGIAEAEAEHAKRSVGYRPSEEQGSGSTVQVVGDAASWFADEVRSSIEFYLTQMPGARVARVLLTGGGSRLKGMVDLLSDRVPAEVGHGFPFHRLRTKLDLSDPELADAEPLFAVAVGLAMPGVRG